MNLTFTIVYDDEDETIFNFPGYVSAYFRAYDAAGEQLLKSFTTQITRSSNVLIFNCSVSDMTFDDIQPNGKFYFEMGYNSSGYEIALRYGTLNIIA